MAKHNLQARLLKLEGQAEAIVASEMLDEFSQKLLAQFKKRKDHIEDWQDMSESNLDNIKNRLRVIADKEDWTVNNVLDMALVSSIVWNEIANGS